MSETFAEQTLNTDIPLVVKLFSGSFHVRERVSTLPLPTLSS